MNLHEQIREMMADGEPRTVTEVAELLDVSEAPVASTLGLMAEVGELAFDDELMAYVSEVQS